MKIEKLTVSYEVRVLALVTFLAIVIFALTSFFVVSFFSRDSFNSAKGDRPLVSYEVVYNGQQVTQVAAWIDRDGNRRYAKEPARVGGIDVSVLVLILCSLILAKGAYDVYRALTGRHKRRLLARYRLWYES